MAYIQKRKIVMTGLINVLQYFAVSIHRKTKSEFAFLEEQEIK
jgi:hypothetical protein